MQARSGIWAINVIWSYGVHRGGVVEGQVLASLELPQQVAVPQHYGEVAPDLPERHHHHQRRISNISHIEAQTTLGNGTVCCSQCRQ